MNEANPVQPFQLYERATLRKVIESYIEDLAWSTIKVEPVEAFDLQGFLEESRKGPLSYLVKAIILPARHGRLFMAYARDIRDDFDKRLDLLLSEKSLLKDDKLKQLLACHRWVLETEQKYDVQNIFMLALDFEWEIRGQDGKFYPITYEYLDLDDKMRQLLGEEFNIRSNFFQWLRMRLDKAINELEHTEFHDPLLTWKVESPKIKIVEVMYALRTAGSIEFVAPESQKLFESYLEKLFSLGKVDWRKSEGEIRSRKEKDKSKYHFLQWLMENPLKLTT
jgi:hypothetical protein